MRLTVYLSSAFLCVRPSIHPSIYLSLYFYTCLSIYLSIYLPVCLSIYVYIYRMDNAVEHNNLPLLFFYLIKINYIFTVVKSLKLV
jgi:hypothetical protein